jgi:hypothetical protein
MRERLRFGVTHPRVPVSLAVVALAGATYTAVTLTDTGRESSPDAIDFGEAAQLLRHIMGDEPPAGPPERRDPPAPQPDRGYAIVTGSGDLVNGAQNVYSASHLRLGGVAVPGTYEVDPNVIPHRVVATLRPKTAAGTITAKIERDVIAGNRGTQVRYRVIVRTYDGSGHLADRSFKLVID